MLSSPNAIATLFFPISSWLTPELETLFFPLFYLLARCFHGAALHVFSFFLPFAEKQLLPRPDLSSAPPNTRVPGAPVFPFLPQ